MGFHLLPVQPVTLVQPVGQCLQFRLPRRLGHRTLGGGVGGDAHGGEQHHQDWRFLRHAFAKPPGVRPEWMCRAVRSVRRLFLEYRPRIPILPTAGRVSAPGNRPDDLNQLPTYFA